MESTAVVTGISIFQLVGVLCLIFGAWSGLMVYVFRSMLENYEKSMGVRFDDLEEVDMSYATDIKALAGKVEKLEKEVERTNESKKMFDEMIRNLFNKVDAIARDLNRVIGALDASRNGSTDGHQG